MAPLRVGAAAGLLTLLTAACGSGTGVASASRAWRAVGKAERPAAAAVGGAPAPLALAAERDHGAAPRPGPVVQVPGDFRTAGWFTGAAEPGQLGPALVAGHVDSRSGPAVFYRLHELRPGDEVRVVRADRRVVRFVVASLARYPKRALPGERLFGPATAPSLRLVTCAGAFDRRRHSYRHNLVVEAAIADPVQESGR